MADVMKTLRDNFIRSVLDIWKAGGDTALAALLWETYGQFGIHTDGDSTVKGPERKVVRLCLHLQEDPDQRNHPQVKGDSFQEVLTKALVLAYDMKMAMKENRTNGNSTH